MYRFTSLHILVLLLFISTHFFLYWFSLSSLSFFFFSFISFVSFSYSFFFQLFARVSKQAVKVLLSLLSFFVFVLHFFFFCVLRTLFVVACYCWRIGFLYVFKTHFVSCICLIVVRTTAPRTHNYFISFNKIV